MLEIQANDSRDRILQDTQKKFAAISADFLNKKNTIEEAARQKAYQITKALELLGPEEEEARQTMLAEKNTILEKIKEDYLIETKKKQKALINAREDLWIKHLVPAVEQRPSMPTLVAKGFRVCPFEVRDALTDSNTGEIFFMTARSGGKIQGYDPLDFILKNQLGAIFDDSSHKGFLVLAAGNKPLNLRGFDDRSRTIVNIPGVSTEKILVLEPAPGSMCLRYIILNANCIRGVENGLITEDVWPQVLEAFPGPLEPLLAAMKKINPNSDLYSEYEEDKSSSASAS